MPALDTPPVMTSEELATFLEREFPQINHGHGSFRVEFVGPMVCRMRMSAHERHLRPGGTVSGPAMFALADLALYGAVLAHIGPVPLAVTTGMSIDFLRKPAQRDLLAECRLLKLGKRLAVGTVAITSDGAPEVVAHATGTYSIPR